MTKKAQRTMHKILAVTFFILFGINQYVIASEKEDTIDSVTVLNEASLEFLGISLDALTYLSQTNYKAFVPKSHLESSKKILLIQELKKAGYINIEETLGLPDGNEPKEKFIRVIPTEKGATVIISIQSFGHNK